MTSVTGPLAPPAPALDVRAAAELRRRRVLESGEERLRKITSRLRADDATAAHASGAAALHTPGECAWPCQLSRWTLARPDLTRLVRRPLRCPTTLDALHQT